MQNAHYYFQISIKSNFHDIFVFDQKMVLDNS